MDKVFTKESFASLVDAKFMKYAILKGLVYDKTTRRASSTLPVSAIRRPTSTCLQTDRFRRWQNLHGEGGVSWKMCTKKRTAPIDGPTDSRMIPEL